MYEIKMGKNMKHNRIPNGCIQFEFEKKSAAKSMRFHFFLFFLHIFNLKENIIFIEIEWNGNAYMVFSIIFLQHFYYCYYYMVCKSQIAV